MFVLSKEVKDHALLRRLRERKEIHKELHWIWRALVVTGAFVVLAAGVAMMVLPGPGLLFLSLGLALLALEFAWAERLLEKSLQGGMQIGGLFGRMRRHPLGVLALVALLLLFAAAAVFGGARYL